MEDTKLDIAAMLGSLLAGGCQHPGSFAWIVGLAMHLTIGSVVLCIAYALASQYMPTWSLSVKSLVFGGIVWLVAQVMVMPIMGSGLFSSNIPMAR